MRLFRNPQRLVLLRWVTRFPWAIAWNCLSARLWVRSRFPAGYRVRQALGQVSVPLVQGRAGRVSRPAHDQPAARYRDARVWHHLHADAVLAAVRDHDADRLRARRADHHPDRRRGYAGGRVDAEFVLGMGGGWHRLLAE